MSNLRVTNLRGRTSGKSPSLPDGVVVTGVATATTFDGNLTGNVTGDTASFTGNVTVGGTLTYEDVTNVDSVGVITARQGIVVTGVVTATSFVGVPAGFTELDAALFN